MQVWPFVSELARGFGGILLQPFFYVAILLVYLQYRRQVQLERKMFGVRVTSAESQTVRSLAYGILGGAAATLLIAGIGIVLNPTDFVYVWAVTVLLALFNLRFICFAYGGGILSVLALGLKALPEYSIRWPWLADTYANLRALSVPHLLALVATLHLVEALLVWLQGKEGASPVFIQGKRGRLIGGFILQKFWVLPLAAVVVTGSGGLQPPAWWILLPAAAVQGLQIFPIPAVLGYSGVALSRHPAEKAARTAGCLALYAIILLGLTLLGDRWVPALLWAAAVFSPAAHELLIKWDMQDEKVRQPRFVKPLQGLRILAVLPGSPAESLELKPGEVIVKANGVPVNTPFDLHFALNQNPAFIKLEVVDEQGEIRFAGKPRFTGEPHSLGLILVPDESTQEYVRLDAPPLWKRIRDSFGRAAKRKKNTTA
ncbi:PDZ domain-containing protein [Effusibacillus pohliae]|uniref:PDZ domain-containing protein n=1 Tax=Effusibacillus pohliae TaxID=232270 RepID=UPI00037CC680|nr:PDZ domain-containing protein [Effusibacillus pohliae]